MNPEKSLHNAKPTLVYAFIIVWHANEYVDVQYIFALAVGKFECELVVTVCTDTLMD